MTQTFPVWISLLPQSLIKYPDSNHSALALQPQYGEHNVHAPHMALERTIHVKHLAHPESNNVPLQCRKRVILPSLYWICTRQLQCGYWLLNNPFLGLHSWWSETNWWQGGTFSSHFWSVASQSLEWKPNRAGFCWCGEFWDWAVSSKFPMLADLQKPAGAGKPAQRVGGRRDRLNGAVVQIRPRRGAGSVTHAKSLPPFPRPYPPSPSLQTSASDWTGTGLS